MEKKAYKIFVLIAIVIIVLLIIISASVGNIVNDVINKKNFKIISSYDNKDLEDIIEDYADKNNIDVDIEYAGTLEIMEKLNSGEKFDSILASNSMWLYMLNNDISVKNSKAISINPIVFGIKKSKAEELGFVSGKVELKDILEAIRQKKLKFAMTSATQTNTGASAYLGFLNTLAGSPEVLTEDMLKDENLKAELTTLFSGVERTSGSEDFLEEMYMSGKYDAIVTYETSIININTKMEDKSDPIYAVYTIDGVSISDSIFAYIDNKDEEKSEIFTDLQKYLLSDETEEAMEKKGRRVWYGGTKSDVDKNVFNPSWGIDTSKYITPIKYPSTNILKLALGMYQSELRKPTYTIFALDYSGSMYGDGNKELVKAMNYILDKSQASKNYLQFSSKDKITIIPFSTNVEDEWTTENGENTEELITKISSKKPIGSTNIYDTITKSLKLVENVDSEKYNCSVVVMTDGMGNLGSKKEMVETFKNIAKDIPVYSILFASADEYQMEEIADITGGKVFDGRKNLLNAFKMVRGYN